MAIRTIRSELLKIILEKNLTKLPGAGMLFFGVFHAFLPAIDKKKMPIKRRHLLPAFVRQAVESQQIKKPPTGGSLLVYFVGQSLACFELSNFLCCNLEFGTSTRVLTSTC